MPYDVQLTMVGPFDQWTPRGFSVTSRTTHGHAGCIVVSMRTSEWTPHLEQAAATGTVFSKVTIEKREMDRNETVVKRWVLSDARIEYQDHNDYEEIHFTSFRNVTWEVPGLETKFENGPIAAQA